MTHHIPRPLLDHLATLPVALRHHIERARAAARELAQAHGLDVERADLGAAAHDILRAMPPDHLLAMARDLELAMHPVEEALPVLLHGPVAARLLPSRFGVTDAEVLEGVHWHSTGQRGLSPLGLVIFLADKLDPQKLRRHPDRQRIRELALEDLDRAVLEYLTAELSSYMRNGGLVHPASVEARNELLLRLKELASRRAPSEPMP